MLIAGLTGGLASGKSFVAAALRGLGCYVIEADELGHEVLSPGGSAYSRAVEEFGEGILREDASIDRSRLAAIVFSDPVQLARLNRIVHPAVQALAQQRFAEIARGDPDGIGIYVAAILVETGGYREFPKLILVTCGREQQIARAMQRAGAKESDVLARLARQMPVEEKKAVADYVIDTGGTVEATLRQTKMVFEELRKLAQ
jgi:dephospho-CoA kinase